MVAYNVLFLGRTVVRYLTICILIIIT